MCDMHSTAGASVSDDSRIVCGSDQDKVIDNSCGKQSDKTWSLITIYPS